jgi:hypothetical protein
MLRESYENGVTVFQEFVLCLVSLFIALFDGSDFIDKFFEVQFLHMKHGY